MKSCYSSTELATKVAFVVRKVGNFGEGNNSNFILIIGHLNSFLTRNEAKRFLLFLILLFHGLCFIGTHFNAFNMFLCLYGILQSGDACFICGYIILLYNAIFHFAFFSGYCF